MRNTTFQMMAATEEHPAWDRLISREQVLYSRSDDIRSPFARDYTRILHSLAYRRLKHKTQVFFNIENDHICTRIEHVNHVESVSATIAHFLGLNEELTKAISVGHDLGHAPFGHQGEKVINALSKEYLGRDFWHEQNGLRFVDRLELLKDPYNKSRNLNLTYAVRDGIISHCGEVSQNGIYPRQELIPLDEFKRPAQYQPATWEGCVVKIADKIAYLGRDIEDAIDLGFLDQTVRNELTKMAQTNDASAINTTVIMHNMVISICENSTPKKGIVMDDRFYGQMRQLMAFNYEHIYLHERLKPFQHYSELVLQQIFETLLRCYDGRYTLQALAEGLRFAPTLRSSFEKWLACYCDTDIVPKGELLELALDCENEKIFHKLEEQETYIQAIIDYISGMTDRFAIMLFNELLTY